MSASTETYSAVTHDIRVSVEPDFLADQSDIANGEFVWSYTIAIQNEGGDTVQLRKRYWRITDQNGVENIVQGPGVVGEQPILNPGDTFRYTSGCPLTTPSGTMVGSYTMARQDGTTFEVDIPAFSLDLPGARAVLN